MYYFASDYMEGAHPKILEKLLETNMEKTSGYGTDHYCAEAKEKIRTAINCKDAEIHFLVGGTQTNATVIKSILRPYEGVISADTGHISVHETGAIETTGHKVLTIPNKDGKIFAKDVDDYIKTFNDDANNEHMVHPGMVYISHPTEYGTLYTKEELKALNAVCKKYNVPLFLDGARLGYGVASKETDVTLETVAEYCDVFYIGGTKIGALFGEAVVITKPNLTCRFVPLMKQQGALLAKGRLLGLQFGTLFTDNLYLEISKHAINMAEKLKSGLKEKGYKFYFESPTNQQFIILENDKMEKLKEKVLFSFWEKYDDNHTVIRFVTSWATDEKDVDGLLAIL